MSKQLTAAQRVLAGWTMALGLAGAQAAPVATLSPPPLDAGFRVQWAQGATVPHSIAATEALFAAPTATATQYLSTINLSDASVPFVAPDPTFGVRATGYVHLAAGDYSFAVTHDDGTRLILGGETVVLFDSDTGARTDFSATYSLAAGLYAVDLLGWEQGGAFDLLLMASVNGGQWQPLEGQHATSTGVPEPATLALVLASLGGLGGLARRRRRG